MQALLIFLLITYLLGFVFFFSLFVLLAHIEYAGLGSLGPGHNNIKLYYYHIFAFALPAASLWPFAVGYLIFG